MKPLTLNSYVLVAVLLSCVGINAMAQETTSSIRGTVLTASGEAISGAQVVITDTRTGTSRTVPSNQGGLYSAHGLRVGGPYAVEVSGRGGSKRDGIFLALGKTLSLNLNVAEEAEGVLEVVTVTAIYTEAASTAPGPVANFDLQDLEDAPAANRDIKDLLRIDPRIYIDEANSDGIQCVGANTRYNSLTLDGIKTNDNFGLNSNGYPTIRIPFSYDAIEQVAVELAPFDVQYGGFTACNINAVTKSGSNEFHGGVFYDYTSDDWSGDSLEGQSVQRGDFTEKRYGFNVGGRILEDRLFFFAAYEELEGATIFNRGPGDSSAAVPVAGVSQAQLDRIRQISNDLYDYDPGAAVSSLPVEDRKILVKLDWQITDNHRAVLTYNYNDGDIIRESDSDSNEYEFSNHYYTQQGEYTTYVASVYSDWTDILSTEVRIGTGEFEAAVTPLGGTDFGEVQIRNEFEGSRATVYLGADDSRHANSLSYENDTVKIAGILLLGNHSLTAGYELERLDVYNLFIQEAEGEYRFSSIDDFEAGTPNRITYENAAGTNNPVDAAAEFSYDINTFYVQDEYYWAGRDVTVTYGLRYDWYSTGDEPPANAAVQEAYGFSNQETLDGKDLLQPRLGINWSVNAQWEVRAGIGLYSGGNPNVWISNNYSNNGVIQLENQDRSGDSLFTEGREFTGTGRPIYDIPQDLYDEVAAGRGRTGGINLLDPDFEIPSEWKYALGATYISASDYVVMVDLLHSEKQDAAIVRDISRVRSGTAPDGRPVYGDNGRRQDFMLTNVSGESGYSTSLSLSLSKAYDFGLNWAVAYAYTDAEDVSPMTSSVAFSNYTNIAVSDPENPGTATSNYEIPHRFTLRIGYRHDFFGDYATRISLFGSLNQGRPYSYVFDGDPGFGSSVGFIDHNLLYIPFENDPNVIYAEGFDRAAFDALINSEGLDRGRILERNSVSSDWWNKFDLKISQEIPGFLDGQKGSAFLVVENLGNLINDDWGVLYETSFPRAQPVVEAEINDIQSICI